jgi:hypothetical protein
MPMGYLDAEDERERETKQFVVELNGHGMTVKSFYPLAHPGWKEGRRVTLADFLHLVEISKPGPDEERDFMPALGVALTALGQFIEHERLEPAAEVAAVRWLLERADNPSSCPREWTSVINLLGGLGRGARVALPFFLELVEQGRNTENGYLLADACRVIGEIVADDEEILAAVRVLVKKDEARLRRKFGRENVAAGQA